MKGFLKLTLIAVILSASVILWKVKILELNLFDRTGQVTEATVLLGVGLGFGLFAYLLGKRSDK